MLALRLLLGLIWALQAAVVDVPETPEYNYEFEIVYEEVVPITYEEGDYPLVVEYTT